MHAEPDRKITLAMATTAIEAVASTATSVVTAF